MSKLETNIIDTLSGTSNLTIGSTNSSTITMPNGKLTGHMYPAFEAYLSADQTLTDASATKIQFNTEVLDTDNFYDNSTNYRFTPTIAGKYLIYASWALSGTSSGQINYAQCDIQKSGTQYRYAVFDPINTERFNFINIPVSAIIDMNGTDDYIEIFGYGDMASGSPKAAAGLKSTFFGAYRIGA